MRIHSPLLSTLTSNPSIQPWRTVENKKQIIASIQHDLSTLLNYRRPPIQFAESHANLASSVLMYGMPDLSYFTPQSEQDRKTVRDLLQNTIHYFEKRLQNVYVAEKKTDILNTNMYFTIYGRLALFEQQTTICFDSSIQPAIDRVFIHPSNQEID